MKGKPEVFDSHLHIIDSQYPLLRNNGYIPKPFSVTNYLHQLSSCKLLGGAVVSGSFQGFDQNYLIAALRALGSSFVGVTQLPFHTSDKEILYLNSLGVKAIRFNLFRGGSESLKHLTSMSARVYELANWHTELYIDSKNLKDLLTTITSLPKVSIDHLGLKKEGFSDLLKLVSVGVKVKASGFSRTDLNIPETIKEIYTINEDALMFGSDLPGTRAPRPFQHNDIKIIQDSLGARASEKVLSRNAMNFYTRH